MILKILKDEGKTRKSSYFVPKGYQQWHVEEVVDFAVTKKWVATKNEAMHLINELAARVITEQDAWEKYKDRRAYPG